jgi:hypothetical protein
MKRGERMSEKTKARISASMKRSWGDRSTRRKMRTQAQIRRDAMNERLAELEERQKRLEYLERAEARREEYARMDEQERQRLDDEEYNARVGPKLPKGVRAIGHGRVIPRHPRGYFPESRAEILP